MHHADKVIAHVARSQQQVTRVLEANRHIAVQMAQLIHALPDTNPPFQGMGGLLENAAEVTKNLVAYLNTLAELQEMSADQLQQVMKALDGGAEE